MQVQVNDISIHYEIDGPEDAPVIACSHCLAGSLDIWDAQLDALRKDFRVLRFDTRGHGGSSAPEGNYSMELLASDVGGLFDALKKDKAHFMGISMGGMIGQTFAIGNSSRVMSLVLCDTACRIPREAGPLWDERIQTARNSGMSALADTTINRWFSPEFQQNAPDTIERIRNIILNTPVSGFAGCSHAISKFDVQSEISGLNVPTLVMVGENDPGTPIESAKQIQKEIPGAKLEVLPKAYHLSNIESAEAFNRALLAFLQNS